MAILALEPHDLVDPAQIVVGLAAASTALVAAITLLRGRRTAGAQLIYQLVVEWDGEAMRKVRRKSARELLESPRQIAEDTIRVLSFFETIAFLRSQSKVLSVKEVWSPFASFLLPLVAATRTDIDKWQESDPTIYDELVALYASVLRFDARRRKRWPGIGPRLTQKQRNRRLQAVAPTSEEVQAYLEGERDLSDHVSAP